MTIDPGVITLIQTTFLTKIITGFPLVSHYAANLLYLLTAIELAIFGMIWALQKNIGWDKLFFKTLRIGLLLLLIQNYPALIDIIMQSFAQLAGTVVNNTHLTQFMFNPATIWQYGYNIGVSLLQFAAQETNQNLGLIHIMLGFGILISIGLIGMQIVLQLVAFYLVAFTGLILLPFGSFSPTHSVFDNTIAAILRAGIRLMVTIITVGIAVTVWDTVHLDQLTSNPINISQPLGLFFTSLLFLYLAIYLPKITAATISDIKSNDGTIPNITITTDSANSPNAQSSPSASNISSIQAATAIDSGVSYGTEQNVAQTPLTANTLTTAIDSNNKFSTNKAGGTTLSGTVLADDTATKNTAADKSISITTINKLRALILQNFSNSG